MHGTVIEFVKANMCKEEIQGKRVLEVGSCFVNGSVRPIIEEFKPSEYVGTDIVEGGCVDIICNVADLVTKFGKESFDIVISTEMMEHVIEWQRAISNIKQVCKKGGSILITTRSCGFVKHDYPGDYWRYEVNDMKEIFSDCEILKLEGDKAAPGVFIKMRKPDNFVEKDLSGYRLYNMG